MLATVRKLVEFVNPNERLHLALLLGPMLCIALLEMASIGFVIPVIQAILPGQSPGKVTTYIIATFPGVPSERLGVILAVVFAVFFIIKNFLLLVMSYVLNRTVLKKSAAFTTRMFELYLGRPLLFHLNRNSAEILRNLMSGATQSYESVRLVLFMVLDCLLMIAALALMLLVEPIITLATAGILASLAYFIFAWTAPTFRRWGGQEMAFEGRMMREINESLSGIREVKVRNAYDFLVRRFGGMAAARAEIFTLANTSVHVPRLIIESMLIVGFLAIVLALSSTTSDPSDVVATLGVFAMAGLRVMPSLNRIVTNASELKRRMAYIDTLSADYAAGLIDTDRKPHRVEVADFSFDRELIFEKITYKYPQAQRHALHNVDIRITKGQSIGIVGPSGSGKSTFIHIALGLLQPQTGRLLVDGKDAFDNLDIWRRRIGFVPQHVHLLDESVRRNIAYGIDDADIDDAQIHKVLLSAQLTDVVANLPRGLDTILGEAGARLSGGQRQRIAIARALYHEPDVLVFDEATSALDMETEREIVQAIGALAGIRTVIVIAHRLSTVRHCDQLIFLRDGSVAGVGQYDRLIQSSAVFRQFVERDSMPERPDALIRDGNS